jgi:hypothetical protein
MAASGRPAHPERPGSAEHEPGAERVGGIKDEPVFSGPVRHALDLGDDGGAISVVEPLNGPGAEAGSDDGLVQELVAHPEPSLSYQFRNSGAGT